MGESSKVSGGSPEGVPGGATASIQSADCGGGCNAVLRERPAGTEGVDSVRSEVLMVEQEKRKKMVEQENHSLLCSGQQMFTEIRTFSKGEVDLLQ